MRTFTAVDLTPQCELKLQAKYEYELLEKIDGAADLIGQCSSEIWRNPESFELPLAPAEEPLVLRWSACSATSGIAILRDQRQTLSISLLASGLDADADRLTLDACQQYIVRQLHGTPFEASFDLIELWQRPVVATIGLFMPGRHADRRLFALADRCFAAAYFRRLGLI